MVKVKENLVGKKFGRLTVIARAEDSIQPCGKRNARWLCECSCDEHNIVIVRGSELKRKNRNGTQSCGCLSREKLSERSKKYNKYDLSGEYGIGYTFNTNNQFYFDLEDYDNIKEYCWFESKNGYAHAKLGITHIKMHQLFAGKGCDHINRNKMDNRRKNLRQATQKENAKNRNRQKNNLSGVTGVGWMKKESKWRARIAVNNNVIYLGYFSNKDEAIKARLQAEKKYFGEFAPQKHLYEQYGVK